MWEEILAATGMIFFSQSLRRFAKLGSWGFAAGVKGRDLATGRAGSK